MSVDSFNPKIVRISCFSSEFSFEIHVTVSDLVPEEIFELWAFFPDGEAIGGYRVRSDKRGKLLNVQGDEDIAFAFTSSSPIKKGSYLLGVIRNEFRFANKPYFANWTASPNDKSHITFQIPYQNQLTIRLNEIGKVPWGSYVMLEGYVAREGHVSTATHVYSGKKISFNGTGSIPLDTIVNELGRFSCVFKVNDNIVKGYKLQAIFKGDEHYKQSSSNIVLYDTLVHDTRLTLQIDPLKLNIPYTQTQAAQKITLKPSEYFRITGLLLDSSLNTSIPSMRIYIEKEFGPNIFDITKEDGTYHIEEIKTPEKVSQYKIRAYFEGDGQYNASKSSEIILLIQDSVSNKDYDMGESLRKMPLTLEQLQESKEVSILHGFKLFHAFNYFENGFHEEKEKPQIISTIWLLSLLQFNPIPLGIDKRDGESLETNGKILNLSADIICSNNSGYSLAIDCTVGVPPPEKLDKILGTAKHLEKHSGKRFVPILLTNKDAPISFEQAKVHGVVVIDKSNIDELLKLIMSNNIEQAIELFVKRINST